MLIKKKISIANIFFFYMIAMATLSSLAIGLVWIRHEQRDFKIQSEILKAEYLETHKQEVRDAVENAVNYINYKKLLTEKLLKQTIRSRVYEAYGIADNIYQQNLEKLSDKQIKASIKQALRPVRFFDNRNYYFIDDLEGNSILFPPNTSFEGNNLIHIKNKEGVRPFPDIIKLVKNHGEGYYIYNWVKYTEGKIPTDKEYPKITFFKLFEPYNWFIAVGEYIDYIEDDIKKEILERVSQIKVNSDEYVRVHSYDGLKLVSDGKVHTKPVNEKDDLLTQKQKKAGQSEQVDFVFYDVEDKIKNTKRPKVLFAQNLSDQEWIVTAAVYLDGVNAVIEGKKSILKADVKRNTIKIFSITLCFWLLALILAKYVSFKSKSSFKSFLHFFQKVSTEAINIDPQSLHFSEFSELAISGNQMIEDRQRAEQMLKNSELRFRQIAENIKEVFWMVSPDYEEVIYISPAYEVVWGQSCEYLYQNPKAWLDSIVTEDTQKIYDFLGKMSLNGVSEIVFPEYRILRPDATQRWISARAFPVLNKDGEIYRLVGIAEDITERKLAEKERQKLQIQLTQAQKIESVGRLAGGVAHDFNNMLSIILGNSEIMMEDVGPNHPCFSNLKEIQNAGLRSADLTRQLLAFARKQTVSPKILNPNHVIEGMLKMLKRLIGEDIDLLWRPQTDLWSIKIDPSQIDQVLANLFVNARDAIKDVGKVTIETGNISFDETYCSEHTGFLPGNYIVIGVSDNGCGMDRETTTHLYEPFFTTKKKGEGTGLGLATVYGIVKQNNGFINVYSELDQGTTFKIYLPRSFDNSDQKAEKEVQKESPKGHETVLLVEDNEAILQMAKQMLERLGYNVLFANDPDEALRIRYDLKTKIDLLITDVVMPSMNGRELAEKILSSFPNMKVLYMSGYTANVIAHRGILDEGLNFINKPFSKQELSIKLREILD